MLISVFTRALRIFIMSVIASLAGFFFSLFASYNGRGIMLISYALFILIASFDAFGFSLNFREWIHFFCGLFFPYIIYMLLSTAGYWFIPPSVYGCIFLPMRTAELIGLKSIHSILLMNIITILIIFIVKLLSKLRLRYVKNIEG